MIVMDVSAPCHTGQHRPLLAHSCSRYLPGRTSLPSHGEDAPLQYHARLRKPVKKPAGEVRHMTRRAIGRASNVCCSAGKGQTSDESRPSATKWHTYASRSYDGEVSSAMNEVLNRSEQDFAGTNAKVQMALLYVSGFRDQDATLRTALQLLRRKYRLIEHVIATVAHGIIGNEGSMPMEVEQAPAVSLTLANMEGAEVTSFTVTGERLPDADASPLQWEGLTGVPLDTDENVSFILLGAPTFAKIDDLLRGLDFAYPEAAKIGGLVSGPGQQGAGTAESPSGWVIAVERCVPKPQGEVSGQPSTSGREDAVGAPLGAQVERQMVWGGCAAMVIRGRVVMEPLVAQGCRPLTEEVYSVEKVVEKGIVLELATTSRKYPKTLRPMEALGQDLATHGGRKNEGELQRMAKNLTVALAPDDFKEANKLEPQNFPVRGLIRIGQSMRAMAIGDFLVRGLVGFDQSTGAMAIGEGVRLGQRMRFMVRDREGAMQDLNDHGMALKRRQLQASMEGRQQPPPFGALMFSCNGRGQNLYREENYDSRTLAAFVPVPFSGMFCNGEIGQVGKSTYLHGFTAAVGILREVIDVEDQAQQPAQQEKSKPPPEKQ